MSSIYAPFRVCCPFSHPQNFVVTYVIRVGRNGLVWTNYVLSCHASIPRNGCPANRPSGVCLFLPCLPVLISLQVSVGVVVAVFKPAFPAVLPNPQNVLEGMIATQCSIAAAAPTFLEVRDHFLLGTVSLSGVPRPGRVVLLPSIISEPRRQWYVQGNYRCFMLLTSYSFEDVGRRPTT